MLRRRALSALSSLASLYRQAAPQPLEHLPAACSRAAAAWPPALHARGVAQPALAEELPASEHFPGIALEPRTMLPSTKCAGQAGPTQATQPRGYKSPPVTVAVGDAQAVGRGGCQGWHDPGVGHVGRAGAAHRAVD